MSIISRVLLIVSIFTIIFIFGFQEGKNSEKFKQEQNQIEIQNEILKSSRQIFKRKAVNKSIGSDDNIEWLQKNRCSDCQNI